MALPEKLHISEVCPRDGWQNFKQFIPTEQKIAFIKRMIDNGAKNLEVTSYVHPKWVPQLADADEVTREILAYVQDKPDVHLDALTLNGKGVDRAIGLGMKNLVFVISASEEHNLRNSNKSTAACLADFEKMAAAYAGAGLNITLAIACTFGSSFGDTITPDDVLRIYEVAARYGIRRAGLADSAGVSVPSHTRAMLRALIPEIGAENISVHFHDTRGMGLANAYAAMEEGISRFESSLGAMGGCPYIPGAKGNIATEDLVWMAQEMGIQTDLDPDRTVALSLEMCRAIGAPVISSQASIADRGADCCG